MAAAEALGGAAVPAAGDHWGGKEGEDARPASVAASEATSHSSPGVKKKAIQVFVRFRPMTGDEVAQGGGDIVQYDTSGRGVTLQHPTAGTATGFAFQHVFPGQVAQSDVYAAAGQPLVDTVLSGINACIMCYGQTASGKTHTMFGPPLRHPGAPALDQPDMLSPTHMGIIPRLVSDIFTALSLCPPGVIPTVKVAFVEVYMENLMDLLLPTRPRLQLRDFGDFCTTNATEVTVGSLEDFVEVLRLGNTNRATAATGANQRSSRSHAIVQFMLCIEDRRQRRVTVQTSVLNMVDLAGSERFDQTGANEARQKEARLINQSLLSLAAVIRALAEAKKRRGAGARQHIPYRASKLTSLLRSSFGGNTCTHLVVNASPHASSYRETLSSLRYGDAAAQIKNKPRPNIEKSTAAIRAELAAVQGQLAEQAHSTHKLKAIIARLSRFASDILPTRVASAAERAQLAARFPILDGLDPTLEMVKLLPAFLLKEILLYAEAATISRVCGTAKQFREYLLGGRRAGNFWAALCRRDIPDWTAPPGSLVDASVAYKVHKAYIEYSAKDYLARMEKEGREWDRERARVFATAGSGAEANATLEAVREAPTRAELERFAPPPATGGRLPMLAGERPAKPERNKAGVRLVRDFGAALEAEGKD